MTEDKKSDPLGELMKGLQSSGQVTAEEILAKFYKIDDDLPMKSDLDNPIIHDKLFLMGQWCLNNNLGELGLFYITLHKMNLAHRVSKGGKGRAMGDHVLSSQMQVNGQLAADRSAMDRLLGKGRR